MAGDSFLVLDGIDGESEDFEFPGSIEILSCVIGHVNTGTKANATGSNSKVNFQDVVFTAHVSRASPLIAQRCADGKSIKKAQVILRRSTGDGGQQNYLTYTFTDVLVTSYLVSHSSTAPDLPIDQFSCSFSKIASEYRQQERSGSHTAPVNSGWDLKNNTPTV